MNSTGFLEKLLTPVMRVEDLDIPQGIVVDLIFRLLFQEGNVNVGRFVEVLGIHTQIIDAMLAKLKQDHLVDVTRAGVMGSMSFTYTLTEQGTARARDAFERSQYVGRAPVSLKAYKRAINAQVSDTHRITPGQVQRALSHLILPENFHRRVGPALNAGSSLFLYGPPGNGKTTIAQAAAKLLADDNPIWLPDAFVVGGQIIRLFDPLIHIPIDEADIMMHTAHLPSITSSTTNRLRIDNRWRLFKRPAVMVGGELTMESLDLRYEPTGRIYEAPLQLKANGGMFLIDDFGRQQISPQELLNRWIVPLESHIDFLRLNSGQTFDVPFRQLIIFSTNLDPDELVDGAFLRRIQMKVEVGGPDEKLFYKIFTAFCKTMGIPFDKQGFVHLVQKWYRMPGREMQAVHPRDILKAIQAICDYEGIAPTLSPELIDEACCSYFVNQQKQKALMQYQPVPEKFNNREALAVVA